MGRGEGEKERRGEGAKGRKAGGPIRISVCEAIL
jgi:hypothetical protein